MIQDFLSHGISIQIWPSNKVTILYAKSKNFFVKMLCQNCQIDQSATIVADWSMPYGWSCIEGKICNSNFITGPYWNVWCNIFTAVLLKSFNLWSTGPTYSWTRNKKCWVLTGFHINLGPTLLMAYFQNEYLFLNSVRLHKKFQSVSVKEVKYKL